MATRSKSKPKPVTPKAGFTVSKRRYGCGGKVSTKKKC
jgi:hypothetical protein